MTNNVTHKCLRDKEVYKGLVAVINKIYGDHEEDNCSCVHWKFSSNCIRLGIIMTSFLALNNKYKYFFIIY